MAIPALHAQMAQTSDSTYTVENRNADKWRVETNKFGANWFIGAGVGAQMYFGDHDRQMRFGDRITPNFEVNFGKWFTPGIGVRLGVNGYKIKGLSAWTGHDAINGPLRNWDNYGGFIKTTDGQMVRFNENGLAVNGVRYEHAPNVGYETYETEQKYLHGHADVLFNVTQMILGYNKDRVYSLIPYASVGFATTLERSKVSGRNSNEATFGVGIINSFQVSKRLAVNLDVRGTYVGDHFDQEDISIANRGRSAGNVVGTAGRWGEGLLTANVGLTYNLGKTDWERSTITTIRVNENVLEGLRGRLGELENINSDLRRQLEAALNREVTPGNVSAMPLLVTFPINRWTLSNKDRVNLGFLADALKANPSLVYEVSGYADRGTGSVKRNIFLARKRAEVVYNCLVKEFGVSESQLKKSSHGGVANMYYNDPRCSRSVLTKLAE